MFKEGRTLVAVFGRNASQISGSISMYGPPSRSTQYGTASNLIDLIPYWVVLERLKMSEVPSVPPPVLKGWATNARDIAAFARQIPASCVRKRPPSLQVHVSSAGPVPPVTTTLQPSWSTRSTSWIQPQLDRLARTDNVLPIRMACSKNVRIDGPPRLRTRRRWLDADRNDVTKGECSSDGIQNPFMSGDRFHTLTY